MAESSIVQRVRENATQITSVLVTGLWLAALFTGQEWWLAFMLFGYVVLVPVVALVFGDSDDIREWWNEKTVTLDEEDRAGTSDQDRSEPQPGDDALAILRERYARGELTEEQFERKLEQLLETETLEDVEDRQRNRLRERDST